MTSSVPPGESYIFKPSSYTDRLNIEQLFGAARPLEVEIGAGDGSFLVEYARQHPEVNILGIERLLGRLRKIDKKSHRAGLDNVRLLRIEASYLVQFLLPREAVESFHIYFADPWPKRRHWKNRLIQESFSEELRGALKMGGVVYLRTDNQDYFDQMVRVMGGNRAFEREETPAALLEIRTDFEREFHRRGVPTLHAAYRRKS